MTHSSSYATQRFLLPSGRDQRNFVLPSGKVSERPELGLGYSRRTV